MTWSFLYPNLCFNRPTLTSLLLVETSVLRGSDFIFAQVGTVKIPDSAPVFAFGAHPQLFKISSHISQDAQKHLSLLLQR